MAEMDDDELLEALGVELAPLRVSSRTPREERIIADFEDILRFHETHDRAPAHGEDRDIFERLYAVRLDRLRMLPEARTLLAPLDAPDLLASDGGVPTDVAALDEDSLLAALGVADAGDDGAEDERDITVLRYVRPHAERRAQEEIASGTACPDFENFQPLFQQVEQELKSGVRTAERFGRNASIEPGDFFILDGQLTYVAASAARYRTPNGEVNGRLRVIFANGTESDLLIRSLQRALYKDETGRRLSDPGLGPLFGASNEPDDIETGTIYVLRSQSAHPFVAEHRELIHKIGVTGGTVESRIANAENDTTFLLAKVDVVATYTLSNLSRSRLEGIFHRVFAAAQLDLTIEDRFGKPARPREWFLVPLARIDEAVERIRDGSIVEMRYDLETASFKQRSST